MAVKANKSRSERSPAKASPLGPSAPHGAGRPPWPAAVALAIIIAALWIIYGRAIHSPFIFDDEDIIIENTSIERLWPLVGTGEAHGPLNPPREISTAGRPLVNLSLAVNYFFGQRNPTGYHVYNILCHSLAVLLLWGICRRAFRLGFFVPAIRQQAEVLAILVTLVWALHPLHSETVTYVTQRTELMVSTCYLATLYASLRYWEAPLGRARLAWATVAGIASWLGMGCKEVMVTAPVVVFLFDRTFVSGSFSQALRKSWSLHLAIASGWILLLWLNFNGPRAGSAGFNAGLAAPVWWLTQTKVLTMYLRLFFWPWPLVIHYEVPYLTTVGAAWPWLVPMLILALCTALLLWYRTAAGYALAWMFLILSPTLVVPIVTEIAVERRMYLASAGLVALFVVGAYRVLCTWFDNLPASENTRSTTVGPLRLVGGACVVLAIVYSTLCVRRLAAYESAISLWEETLRYDPADPTALTNLGVALAADGRPAEAIPYYEQALRIKPDTHDARANLAEAWYDLGLKQLDANDPAKALSLFQTAVDIRPDFPNAHYAMAAALVSQGNLPSAVEQYRTAVRQKPDYIQARVSLAVVLMNMGDLAGATQEFFDATRQAPDNGDARMGLALAYLQQNKPAEAQAQLLILLRLEPGRAEAHFELANLMAAQNDLRGAIDHYREALRVRPSYVEALQNLGAALLALGDTRAAIAPLQEVLRLQPENPQARANLERAEQLDRERRAP